MKHEVGKFIELDVREELRNNIEPFEKIMGAVEQLNNGEKFILHATFNPLPLHKVMKRRGFNHKVEEIEEEHWKVVYERNG